MNPTDLLVLQSWPLLKVVVALGLSVFALTRWRISPMVSVFAIIGFTMEGIQTGFGIWFQYWINESAKQGVDPTQIGIRLSLMRAFFSAWGILALVALAAAIFAARENPP